MRQALETVPSAMDTAYLTEIYFNNKFMSRRYRKDIIESFHSPFIIDRIEIEALVKMRTGR